MTNRKINNSVPPDMYGQPSVYFRPKDFEAAIWAHGYDVTCEQAVTRLVTVTRFRAILAISSPNRVNYTLKGQKWLYDSNRDATYKIRPDNKYKKRIINQDVNLHR